MDSRVLASGSRACVVHGIAVMLLENGVVLGDHRGTCHSDKAAEWISLVRKERGM